MWMVYENTQKTTFYVSEGTNDSDIFVIQSALNLTLLLRKALNFIL